LANAPSESKVIFEQASQVLADAFASGVCSDPQLLVAAATQLNGLDYDKPKQLLLTLDAVRFLYVSGRTEFGLKVAEQSKRLALELADAVVTAQVLTLIGICAADTGNLPLAMEAYRDGLSLTQQTGDLVQEGKIWHSLGAALAYSGLYREAVSCYGRAIEIVPSAPQLASNLTGLYLNIAASHLNLDEPAQGLVAIKRSIELAANPVTQHEILNRVLAENYCTRLLIDTEDYTGAVAHAQSARKYASQSKSPRADITASVAEGLAEVFSGQPDIGISRLSRTLERAKTLKVATREVLVAIVKAHEHIGQHDKALEYLKQMLAAQRQTQEANVLRHVERHLEQLHAKGDVPIEDSKQAIKRLETRQELLEGRIAKRDLFRQSVEGLERLAVATELRDDSTGEHSYRVGRMASLLAKEAGYDEEMVYMIDIAARLHDIGKIAIPDGILLKPASFNAGERVIMEMHANAGADVLAKSNIPQIQMAEEIARYHHERWDGKGYPKGLVGEAIPLAARITALADVFDALTHVRPYKQAWPIESALTEILSLRGRHFDPTLTDVFLRLVSRMIREGIDLDHYLGEAARQSSFHQAKGKIWDSLKLAKEEYQAKYARTTDLQR
jgi:putative two-component system response regulator